MYGPAPTPSEITETLARRVERYEALGLNRRAAIVQVAADYGVQRYKVIALLARRHRFVP